MPLDARDAALRTGETNVGNYVTDVMRARLRADVAVMNGGGIRGNQLLPAGPLTRRDLNALLPFLNVLVMLEVPGKRPAGRAGAVGHAPTPRSSAGSSRSRGSPSSSTRPGRPASASCGCWWAGEPLDPERRYTLATNDYTARGGDGYAMLATAKPLVFPEDGPGLAEALLEAVERAGSIAPVTEGRITRMSP